MSKRSLRKNLLATFLAVLMVVMAGTYCSAEMGKININTATVEQLVKLDRIGDAYAARIVEYRETMGRFEKPEDIMKVKGIGQKTWDANKDRIVV
jgi:competence protein ComEA